MALQLNGFVTPEQGFEGLYRAGDILERNKIRDERVASEREGRLAATGKFLTDYLDPKDRLTGTNYDPEIVKQLNDALIEGADLAKKGAGTSEILMALGPKVGKINEYSQKAKLISKQISDAATKLKTFKGYNTDALSDEAKKLAFYDENGKLKDISTIDPNTDYVTELVKTRPELVTSSAGLDELVKNAPVREYGSEVQTMFGGKKRNIKYDAKSPFWMDVEVDENGNAITDKNGNPVGLDVKSETWKDDKGNPIADPETGKPFKMLEKGSYNAIMQHNPDVADFVRGQVISTFKQLGKEVPKEDSPQWEGMARHVLYSELKTRDKSYFKPRDLETKSPLTTRIELGIPVGGKGGSGGGGGQTTGNAFDAMDDAEYENFNIEGGVFYNKDGTPKNGEVFITGDKIPASIKTALNAGGIKPEFLLKGITAQVKNGLISSISNKLIGSVTRKDMEDVYQPMADKEPLKGKKLQFANKNQSQKPETKKERKSLDSFIKK